MIEPSAPPEAIVPPSGDTASAQILDGTSAGSTARPVTSCPRPVTSPVV
eukprot:CAMPEP_0180316382 /NCGR_PEP_ID=MMETSP0988-20121125/33223_1 /TAXON_ID=697907 /ORGANISM="non described non described, Strain CCMP2293" /LENGTH=48 /DNA_ID= /DNA_START= /DNA_END= /DNA_ORIENTATION=